MLVFCSYLIMCCLSVMVAYANEYVVYGKNCTYCHIAIIFLLCMTCFSLTQWGVFVYHWQQSNHHFCENHYH